MSPCSIWKRLKITNPRRRDVSGQSTDRPDAPGAGAPPRLEPRPPLTAMERAPPTDVNHDRPLSLNMGVQSAVAGPQSSPGPADSLPTVGPVLGSPKLATVENVENVKIEGGLFVTSPRAVIHYTGISNEYQTIKGKEVAQGSGNCVAGLNSGNATKIDTDSHLATMAKSKGKAKDNSQGTQRKDYDIYYGHLLLAGRGSPMWRPGPNMMLSKEYRKNGIGFGDIGIIYRSEGFSFLFNIFLEADHPINKGRVPRNFKPFDFGKVNGDLEKTIIYERGDHLSSSSLRKISGVDPQGFIFETRASEGAILIMPDGGSAEDLLNHRLVKKYIARHAESWYRYIRGDRGREVKNGDIRLVIGFDKVSSWGIATFAKNVEERVRLEFKTIDSDQPASRTHIWNCVDGGSGRVGPKEEEMEGLMVPVSESNSSPIKNQTVFVRTLNFNLKGEAWDDLTCHEIRSSDHSSNNSGSRPSQGPSGPSGGQSSSGDEESNSDQGLGNVNFGATQFGLSVVQHPSNRINDLLLKKFPDVQIVITDDLDWISLLRKGDVVFPSPDDLCERLLPSCEIWNEDGILTTFSNKKQNNKDPNQPDILGGVYTMAPLRQPSFPENITVRRDKPKIPRACLTLPSQSTMTSTTPAVLGTGNSTQKLRKSLRAATQKQDTKEPRRPNALHRVSFISPSLQQESPPSPALQITTVRTSLDDSRTPSSRSRPETGEVIRSATAVLCKEMARPPPNLRVKGDWDHVEIRLQPLIRAQRIWSESPSPDFIALTSCAEESERSLFADALWDGYILCQLLNKLCSRPIVRPDPRQSTKTNITKFLAACASLGLSDEELFAQDDLVKAGPESLARVAKTILRLVDFIQREEGEKRRGVVPEGKAKVIIKTSPLLPTPTKVLSPSPSSSPYGRSHPNSPTTSSRAAASTPNLLMTPMRDRYPSRDYRLRDRMRCTSPLDDRPLPRTPVNRQDSRTATRTKLDDKMRPSPPVSGPSSSKLNIKAKINVNGSASALNFDEAYVSNNEGDQDVRYMAPPIINSPPKSPLGKASKFGMGLGGSGDGSGREMDHSRKKEKEKEDIGQEKDEHLNLFSESWARKAAKSTARGSFGTLSPGSLGFTRGTSRLPTKDSDTWTPLSFGLTRSSNPQLEYGRFADKSVATLVATDHRL